MSTIIRKILIVEDTEIIREVMSEALEIEGYEVHAAGDGREALACT